MIIGGITPSPPKEKEYSLGILTPNDKQNSRLAKPEGVIDCYFTKAPSLTTSRTHQPAKFFSLRKLTGKSRDFGDFGGNRTTATTRLHSCSTFMDEFTPNELT